MLASQTRADSPGALAGALAFALVCAVAVAARWRRLSESASGADIDAATAEITTELTCMELDEGMTVAVPFVVLHRNPPIPDRPWFWFAAITCPTGETTVPGFNVVHDRCGFSPNRRHAVMSARQAMDDLQHPTPVE